MADAITASFGMDIGPLKRAFTQAEAVARSGGQKVAQELQRSSAKAAQAMAIPFRGITGGGTGPHFDAMAERRRRNSAAGFAPAPPGKYALPDEEEGKAGKSLRGQIGAGRLLRSLLVFSGIQTFLDDLQRASEELLKRRQTIIDLTTAGSGFQSAGGARSNLGSLGGQLSEMHRGQLFDQSNWLRRTVANVRDFFTGDSPAEREQQKAALRQQASNDVSQIAREQQKLNDAERESLHGSEAKAKLLREEATWMENIYEIAKLQAATGTNNPAALNAERERHRQAGEEIVRAANIATASRMIERQRLADQSPFSGLTSTQQRGYELGRQIEEVRRQLRDNPSEEQRGLLRNRESAIQNDIDTETLKEWRKTPAQRLAERTRVQDELIRNKQIRDSAGLFDAHRDLNGRIIGGRNALTNDWVSVNDSRFSMDSFSKRELHPDLKAAINMTKDNQSKAVLTEEAMDRIAAKYWGN